MLGWRVFCASAVTLTAVLVAPAAADPGMDPEAARFVELIATARADAGLHPMRVDPRLTEDACTWSQHQAATGVLAHDPSLRADPPPWPGAITIAAENVGVGGEVGALWDAFWNSPSHHENLVNPDLDRVGVCVSWVSDGSRFYVTQRFAGVRGSGAQPTTTTVPAPTTTAPPVEVEATLPEPTPPTATTVDPTWRDGVPAPPSTHTTLPSSAPPTTRPSGGRGRGTPAGPAASAGATRAVGADGSAGAARGPASTVASAPPVTEPPSTEPSAIAASPLDALRLGIDALRRGIAAAVSGPGRTAGAQQHPG